MSFYKTTDLFKSEAAVFSRPYQVTVELLAWLLSVRLSVCRLSQMYCG